MYYHYSHSFSPSLQIINEISTIMINILNHSLSTTSGYYQPLLSSLNHQQPSATISLSRRQENKETRVPVSCQIYPPPVSIDAKLLPPLTDGQAAREEQCTPRSVISNYSWNQWKSQVHGFCWLQVHQNGLTIN